MKIFTAFAFMAVLVGTFSNVIIESAFYLQQDYIASEKCENRAKPCMHCAGKCYLKKQLQQDEQRKGQSNTSERTELVWFNESVADIALNTIVSSVTTPAEFTFVLTPGHIRPVDRPPGIFFPVA